MHCIHQARILMYIWMMHAHFGKCSAILYLSGFKLWGMFDVYSFVSFRLKLLSFSIHIVSYLLNDFFSLYRTSISNYSLQKILQPNMRFRLQYPFACKVTIPGIKNALQVCCQFLSNRIAAKVVEAVLFIYMCTDAVFFFLNFFKI